MLGKRCAGCHQRAAGSLRLGLPYQAGDTLFKYVYHLPYSGPSTLQVKLPYPIRNFAVMHPPSMTFKPSSTQAFTSPGLAQGLRVEQAVGKPVVRVVPTFEISGIGLAAQIQPAGASPAMTPAAAVAPSRPETPASVTLPGGSKQAGRRNVDHH